MQNACKCRRFVLAGDRFSAQNRRGYRLIDAHCQPLSALRQHKIVAVNHLRLRHVAQQFLKLR